MMVISALATGFLLAPGVHAADFGMFLIGEYNARGEDETLSSGSVIAAPWVSLPFGDAELYLSAGLNANIEAEKNPGETYFAPEIFRFEFSYNIPSFFLFRMGRINWQDPSGFVAKGRFDGADFLFDLGKIRLGINALYTGFLFKDTAEINKSPMDTKDYNVTFDWSDFGNTYFAPKRLLTSLYGEFPGFPAGRGQFYAGIMAQIDLSDADELFNTQYLMLRHRLAFMSFDLDIAGAAELENTKADGLRPGFAFSLEAGLQLPTEIKDRLSLGLAWASGEGSSTGAFFPVSKKSQTFVLEPLLSGIMIIRANYSARLLPSLSMDLGGCYLLRTDSTSFSDTYIEGDAYALGAELGAGLQWVPFSDLLFTVRGGVFLPKTGAAWADNAPVQWKVTLGTVFSF